MLFVGAGFRALRHFNSLRLCLFAVALFLTFGFGGGTPNTAAWMIGKVQPSRTERLFSRQVRVGREGARQGR